MEKRKYWEKKSEVDKRIEKYDKKVRIRGEIVEDKRWKIYVRMKKTNEKIIKKNFEKGKVRSMQGTH